MDKIPVYIVDDHRIIIDGISSYLIGNSRFELTGSACSSQKLFSDIKSRTPAILILDIKLNGLSGIQIAKIISKDYPGIKILFLSSNLDEETLNEAVRAGGKGFLNKDVTENEFFIALETIIKGEFYYGESIRPVLFENYARQVIDNKPSGANGLTEREMEIIRLIADGLSHKEIADKLYISTRTVETHKKNILSKLNLTNTAGLIKYAILNGYTGL